MWDPVTKWTGVGQLIPAEGKKVGGGLGSGRCRNSFLMFSTFLVK